MPPQPLVQARPAASPGPALPRERLSAAERQRLALELHDLVAHSVTLMVSEAAGRVNAGSNAPADRRAFAKIEATGAKNIGELRSMLRVLHDSRDLVGPQSPSSPASSANQPASAFTKGVAELVERMRQAGLVVEELTDLRCGR